MNLSGAIETGRDYYWKRSDGWDWWLRRDNSEKRERRWWTYYIEFKGLNGAGGAWIIEKAQWNGETVGSHFTQAKSLSWQETAEMIQQIHINLHGVPVPKAARLKGG